MMKKHLFGVIVVMALILTFGIFYGRLFRREYTRDEYGVELSRQDAKIEELEDSIRRMQLKLDIYDKAVKWFRNADSEELQRGIEQIRCVPKDVPLP